MKKKIYLGLLALMAAVLFSAKANAQFLITNYSVDTGFCGNANFYVATNSFNIGDASVIIYFGDGTSATFPSDSGFVFTTHGYTSGSYTIKIVVVDNSNGNHTDSVTASYINTISCNALLVDFYEDMNANCIYDAGDHPMYFPSVVEIDSNGVAVETTTLLGGYYYPAYGPSGTVYTFKIITPPSGFDISCPSNGIINETIPAVGLPNPVADFGYVCSAIPAFDLTLQANFSVGVDGAGSHIYISNQYCQSTNATLTIDYSPLYAFDQVWQNAYPYTVTGNSVTINIGAVSANNPVSFIALWNPVGTLTLGDTACATFTLNPLVGDMNPTNNVISTCDPIMSSHDPNFKSVMPEGDIDPGTQLQYFISFENTGNDTAFNIHILDTLSNNLDVNTLQVVSSSAKMNLSTYEISDGRTVVKFDFPHINLLDTSHHSLCDGMVSYKIKAKTGLAIGTTIDNKAGIYFDANEVVMTNNVENKIGTPAGVSTVSKATVVNIYPNPATNELTIETGKDDYNTLKITNSLGQVIMQQQLQPSSTQVNVNKLAPGLYYITLTGNKGVEVQKLEKL